jgi:hypothetical protein
MPDGARLRTKAREAIQNGTLPARVSNRLLGGPGNGDACALCGESIPRGEVEFELEFMRDDAASVVDRYHLHPRCFEAWDHQRTKMEPPERHLSA